MKAIHITLFSVFITLVGCSGGEPSESDISGAIEKQLKSQLESSGGIFK